MTISPQDGMVPEGYLAPPKINDIAISDVTDSLKAGLSDFKQSMNFGLFFGAFYAIGGAVMTYAFWSLGWYHMIFPAATGFFLIGPIIAVGLYRISSRIERERPLEWKPILFSYSHHGRTQLLIFGFLLAFLLIVWLRVAGIIYALHFGPEPIQFWELVERTYTTPAGLSFFLFGNIGGAILAATVFAVCVVSVPMIMDKEVDFMTATMSSVRAVMQNPVPMLYWALIVGAAVIISFATAFLGLVILLPILGHATWHLYTKVVDRSSIL